MTITETEFTIGSIIFGNEIWNWKVFKILSAGFI